MWYIMMYFIYKLDAPANLPRNLFGADRRHLSWTWVLDVPILWWGDGLRKQLELGMRFLAHLALALDSHVAKQTLS